MTREEKYLDEIGKVVAELRAVQARHEQLLARRHWLAARLIATGNWSFSGVVGAPGV